MSFDTTEFLIVSLAFFVVAVAYSSVGHAGASGYAAILALFNAAPEMMRPTSLVLNICVGSFGIYRFYKAGLIDFKKVMPFLLGSIPAAFFSAQIKVDKKYFYLTLGVVLLFSSCRLLFKKTNKEELVQNIKPIVLPVAIITGALIGFLSGITGTGGAIFFTPLLLAAHWAAPREASGLSVVFVLVNSIFGLAGIGTAAAQIPIGNISVWGVTVLLGAFVGTYLGIKKLREDKLVKVLGGVLLVASLKLLSGAFH